VKVTIATLIKSGNYKHLQPRANRLVHFVGIWEARLKRYIDYHPDVEITICPIRRVDVAGQALLGTNKIEVDPRFTLRDQCKAVIHELVHNEQVNQTRLEVGAEWKWSGVFYTKASSYKEYINLPWEVEARTRTKEIFPAVF
tara:strand:- start:840 stop:1265 length:426 start_codon:yes stop_codon:yes gene_type:complete